MKSTKYRWVILISCIFIIGGTYGIEGGTAGIFANSLSNSLGIHVSKIQLMYSLKGITMVLFTPLSSRLLKNYNINVVLGLASLTYTTGIYLLSTLHTKALFYITWVVLGIASSFLATVIVPIIIHNWFEKRQGLFLGIGMGFSGIFGAISNLIISNVINHDNWRVGYQNIALFLLFTLLPITFFFIKLRPDKNPSNQTLEIKIANNRSISKYLKSKSFIYSIMFGISLALSNGILYNLPTHLKSSNTDISIIVLATSISLLSATIGKFVFGYLNDHLTPLMTVYIASTLGALGILLIALFPSVGILVLIGTALYGAIISLMTLEPPIVVRHVFGNERYADIFVFVSMATQLFYALSPTIYAYLYGITNTYNVSLTLTIIFCLLSPLFCHLSIKNSKHII